MIRARFPSERSGKEGEGGPRAGVSDVETGIGELGDPVGDALDSEDDPWAFESNFGLAPTAPPPIVAPSAPVSMNQSSSQKGNDSSVNSAQRERPAQIGRPAYVV